MLVERWVARGSFCCEGWGCRLFSCWAFFSPGKGGGLGVDILPSSSASGSGLKDFTQEKSIFCRIR